MILKSQLPRVSRETTQPRYGKPTRAINEWAS